MSSDSLRRPLPLWILLIPALLYAIPVALSWNKGYLDFGDGNYMYISWRLSQGTQLYSEILAPQPPLHLYIGSALAWLGEKLFPHPIFAFRLFSLLLHLATMLLVFKATTLVAGFNKKLAHSASVIGLISSFIYLLLPIGFWWTLGYQTQPLLIFLLLASLTAILSDKKNLLWIAGICGGLAVLTNMTTVPYVLFLVGWLFLRKTKDAYRYLIPAVAIPAIVITALEIKTGAYMENVINNQAGAFPRSDVLAQSGQTLSDYIINKITNEGSNVLRLEGIWIALAILGIFQFTKNAKSVYRELALYFTFFSICSILYVSKGGTVDYVFSLAGPYLAIFAAITVFKTSKRIKPLLTPKKSDLTFIAVGLFSALFCLITLYPGVRFSYQTLHQQTYELTERETMRFANILTSSSRPDQEIIAPPHLAFIAKRKIAQEYSEHLLWRLKYMNERLDNSPGRAVQTITQMAEQIKNKELPVIIMDMNQTGTIPEIVEALKQSYTPTFPEPYMTRNTPLQVYKPVP